MVNIKIMKNLKMLLALSYINNSIKASYNISIKQVKEDLFYREKWDIDI